jgi:hypothetical protein
MSGASWGLEGLRPCTITVSSERLATRDDLERYLAERRGDGWVCLTDRVLRWRGGMPPGMPLAGELALDEHRSVHIRRAGDGWLATLLSEEAAAGAQEGVLFREGACVEERLLESSAPKDAFTDFAGGAAPPFRYRVFYRTDADGVYRPYAARFAGWRLS